MKTVEEVRRERLLELKAAHKSFAAINKLLGRTATDSTLSQIANQSEGSKTSKPKMMGSPQARAIEDGLALERGWMDTDPELLRQVANLRNVDPSDTSARPELVRALEVVAAAFSQTDELTRLQAAPLLDRLVRDPAMAQVIVEKLIPLLDGAALGTETSVFAKSKATTGN